MLLSSYCFWCPHEPKDHKTAVLYESATLPLVQAALNHPIHTRSASRPMKPRPSVYFIILHLATPSPAIALHSVTYIFRRNAPTSLVLSKALQPSAFVVAIWLLPMREYISLAPYFSLNGLGYSGQLYRGGHFEITIRTQSAIQ